MPPEDASILHRNFGRLRSLAADQSTEHQRRALLRFCAAMRKHAPDAYQEQWGAYLASLSLPAPFLEVSCDELVTIARVLPGARVALQLDIDEIERWPQDSTLHAIHRVSWLRGPRHDHELRALLAHPIAARLTDLALEPSVYLEPEVALGALLDVLEQALVLPPIRRVRLEFDASPHAFDLRRLGSIFSLEHVSVRASRGLTLGPLSRDLLCLPGAERLRSIALLPSQDRSYRDHVDLDLSAGTLCVYTEGNNTHQVLRALEEVEWDVALEELELSSVRAELEQLERLPRCAKLQRLHLTADLLDGDLEAFFARWPGSRGLRHLELHDCQDLDVFTALANAPSLCSLQTLYVWRSPLPIESLSAFARAPHWAALRQLRFFASEDEETSAKAQALLRSAHALSGCDVVVSRGPKKA